MGSEGFYAELPSFNVFAEVVENSHYHQVPSDWSVIITDVEGSTRAIEAGRYKDVNTVGAAAIACIQNAMPDLEFPFVFGGDGATALIPNSRLEVVSKELAGLRELSEETFGLRLRVGLVSVEELQMANAEVEVGKFELAHGKCISVFRGGGLGAAEELVKGSSDRYEVRATPPRPANLAGLSCRWRPIPNRHGNVLSLLVVSRLGQETYAQVLAVIEATFDGNLDGANPVNTHAMTYRTIRDCMADERRYYQSRWSLAYWYRVLEIIVAHLIFRRGMPGMYFNARAYKQSMATHSDYRKFDDALRMIIDCSNEQAERICSALKDMHHRGAIYYGVHQSKESLMTCLVDSVKPGRHIHFVDGGSGGYAMAAKQLKAQMREAQAA